MKIFNLNNLMKYPIFAWAIIILVGIISYSNTFHSDFQFDDNIFIIDNFAIRDLGNIKGIGELLSQPSRFVAFYSFALNYHFHQLDVFGYHVTNFVIHLITAMLVWWFVGMLVGLCNRKHTPGVCMRLNTKYTPPGCVYGSTIALFTALIFVAHPVQTQAVTYIAQRFASLATLFYLLSVCLYIKGRIVETRLISSVYFLGAAVSAILGMFTKEIVITLPLTVLLIECMFLGGVRKIKEPRLIAALLFVLIIPALFSFNISDMLFAPKISESHAGDVITFGTYVMTQFRVLMTFVKLSFFPIGQNVEYDFALSQHFFEIPTLLSFLALGAMLGIAFKIRARYTLITFGIFWFFLTLLPNFIPRRNIIFEHKLYLPMIGFSLMLSMGIFRLMKNVKKGAVVLSIIVCVLAYLTFQRNKVWTNEVTLWEDVVQKSPHKLRPQINLGRAYFEQGQYDKAMVYLDKAVSMEPDDANAYNNRGAVYGATNQKELALKDFNRALAIDPDLDGARSNRGAVYRTDDKSDLALEDFNKALEINPYFYKAYHNRGIIHKKKGSYDLALDDYNKALALNPLYAKVYGNRGMVYEATGRYDLALADFNKALEINPGIGEVYNNRGVVYKAKGQYDLAMKDYSKAVELNPQYAMAFNNRGAVHAVQNQDDMALADYSRAIEIDARLDEAYSNRGIIYGKKGQYDLAMKDLNKALAINPELDKAYYNRGLIYIRKQQYDLALENLTQAIVINPQYDKAYTNRGAVYERQGKDDLALADFTRAVEINPQLYVAYNNRGTIYKSQGKYARALEDFNKALAINPNYAMAYKNRASIYQQKNRESEAKADLQKFKMLGKKIDNALLDGNIPKN